MKSYKRLLLIPLAVGTMLLGVVGSAYAFSQWQASQTGYNQSGSATSNTLRIAVEAGLDPDTTLLPDSFNCQFQPCPGGAVAFTIENKSSVPLRVFSVEQRQVPCNGQNPPCMAPILSDKNTDGSWTAPSFGSINNCGSHASFVTLNGAGAAALRQWPAIPPHTTLHVNGSDALALGVGAIHLDFYTPNQCMGASFYVPLTVSAQDAS